MNLFIVVQHKLLVAPPQQLLVCPLIAPPRPRAHGLEEIPWRAGSLQSTRLGHEFTHARKSWVQDGVPQPCNWHEFRPTKEAAELAAESGPRSNEFIGRCSRNEFNDRCAAAPWGVHHDPRAALIKCTSVDAIPLSLWPPSGRTPGRRAGPLGWRAFGPHVRPTALLVASCEANSAFGGLM